MDNFMMSIINKLEIFKKIVKLIHLKMELQELLSLIKHYLLVTRHKTNYMH